MRTNLLNLCSKPPIVYSLQESSVRGEGGRRAQEWRSQRWQGNEDDSMHCSCRSQNWRNWIRGEKRMHNFFLQSSWSRKVNPTGKKTKNPIVTWNIAGFGWHENETHFVRELQPNKLKQSEKKAINIPMGIEVRGLVGDAASGSRPGAMG